MFIDFGLAKDRDGGCYLRCVLFFNFFAVFIVHQSASSVFFLKETEVALGTYNTSGLPMSVF